VALVLCVNNARPQPTTCLHCRCPGAVVLIAAVSVASLVKTGASVLAIVAAATLAAAPLLVVPVFEAAAAANVTTPAAAAAVIVVISAMVTAAAAVITTPRHLDLQQGPVSSHKAAQLYRLWPESMLSQG
jgi:hypothetical protein